jgi:hypothetical protein
MVRVGLGGTLPAEMAKLLSLKPFHAKNSALIICSIPAEVEILYAFDVPGNLMLAGIVPLRDC